MNEKLVSIIIPAYKTEKYADQSVQSALNQTYPAIEIILVDDGSPDHCPEIFDAYAAKYERISVIHQENQGLGMARNAGIRAARGEYVFMLDSDDCLDGQDAIANLMEEARRSGADVIVGNYRKFQDDKLWDVNHHHLRAGEYQRTASFRFDGFYRYGHLAYNWGKLYRRSFLVDHGIWCRAYPFTQDKAHNILCYAYQPQYAFIEKSVYLYRINDESITFRYKPDLIPVWISIAKDFHQELRERGVEDAYGDLTAFHVFFGSFFIIKQELMAKHGLRKATAELKKYAEDPFVREKMKELAKGKYLRDVTGIFWKIPIRFAAILFNLRGYFLYTLGIAALRGMRIDGMISEKRNRSRKKRQSAKMDGMGGRKIVSANAAALCRLLTVALTGERLGEEEKEQISHLDLGEILEIADQHRVLPMLFDIFEDWEEILSDKDRERLEKAAEKTVGQSYRLLFLTKELTELFSQAGIPVVTLKGCGIASYYPVPEYRKSGDVDLLFSDEASVRAAGKLLEERGFFVSEEQHANHHLVYQGPNGVDVELHAMLAEPFDDPNVNQRMEEYLPLYLAERTTTDSMGVSIPTTSEPLQALELLLHMLQHFLRAGFGLKLLTDWVVFWNKVMDENVAARYADMAKECGVLGFSKAVTLLCEKYLGLNKIHVHGENLENEFTRNYAEHFLMEVVRAEEFGKSDKNRMVVLRKKGLWGYVKEFHYQMRMNHPEESKKKWKWPYLWVKTLVTFLKNNRRLGRGSIRGILKSAGERASVAEEMRLFKNKR